MDSTGDKMGVKMGSSSPPLLVVVGASVMEAGGALEASDV